MGIPQNTVEGLVNHFKNELKPYLDFSELEQSLAITFSHYLGFSRIDLVLNKDDLLEENKVVQIEQVIRGLKTARPLAHLLGKWEFNGLMFKVNEHTLIPRPETEELVQLIVGANKSRDNLSILDIGTGSGCIAISLKKELKNSALVAFDVSKKAIAVARENAKINGTAVRFENVDIFNPENVNEKFDIIVSNPPYITNKEKALMHANVLDYEPHLALFVEDTAPLLYYSAIADFAWAHLNKKGELYFEINEFFGKEVKEMLTNKKFKNVNIVKDINEKDRIVYCNI